MPLSNEGALSALALAKPGAERAAWLDAECDGDAALRARLEALLAAHEQPDTLLATPYHLLACRVAVGGAFTGKLKLRRSPEILRPPVSSVARDAEDMSCHPSRLRKLREIYCFDTETGKPLWRHDVRGIPGTPPEDELPDVMETSGLAAPTATTDGRYLAALFGTGELVCTDLNRKRIWAKAPGSSEQPLRSCFFPDSPRESAVCSI